MEKTKNIMRVYGIRPIIELLDSEKEVQKIYIQKNLKNEAILDIEKKAKSRKIEIKYAPIQKLNRLTRKNHQELHKAHLARIQLPGMHPLMYQ